MSEQHTAARDTLAAWSAPDSAQEHLRAAYVEHLDAHPDGLTRACYPDHLTASALVLSADRSRALLTLHRKAGRWFQFGGHIETGDADLYAAALREATEESGITDLADLLVDPSPAPAQLDLHEVPFCNPRGEVRHLDVRFVLMVPDGTEPRTSAESFDVRWWPVDALPTEELSVRALVDRAVTR